MDTVPVEVGVLEGVVEGDGVVDPVGVAALEGVAVGDEAAAAAANKSQARTGRGAMAGVWGVVR